MHFKKCFCCLFLFVCLWQTSFAQQIPSDSMVVYNVKQGDNLYRLSVKFNCTIQQIKDWNDIKNEDYVQIGKKITLFVSRQSSTLAPVKSQVPANTSSPEKEVTTKSDSTVRTIHYIHVNTIDSLKPKLEQAKKIPEKEIDLAFDGTRITERDENYDSTGKLSFSGYVSTYYAYYTDSVGLGKYEKFPTSAPISNAFSLNMLMINAKYSSTKLRGNFTLHYGDIPSSAWSNQYNLIQEANIGLKISRGIWFDAGFFRTHLGVESIQPRENITSSVSTVTYYEPYYLSGAKLTFHLSPHFSVQINAFNGFNSFVETNKNKAIGFSTVYDISSSISLNFNTIYCDESPDNQTRKQARLYNNFYLTFKSKRIDMAAEINYGIQQNSNLTDSSKQADMFSVLLITRLKFNRKLSLYGRGEYFKDQNEILTGPVLNEFHQLVGLHLWGATMGFEIKPITNSYLRFEWRRLQTIDSDEKVFYYKQKYENTRDEFIAALGLWF
jgi:Putative beta-barrel porin-2, OmpL-like. bbp2/LysM domain